MRNMNLLTVFIAIYVGLFQFISAVPIALVKRNCPPGTTPVPCQPNDPMCNPTPQPYGPRLSFPDFSCIAMPALPPVPPVPGLPVPGAPQIMPITLPVPEAPGLPIPAAPMLPPLPGLPDLSGLTAGLTLPAPPALPPLALPGLGGD